MLPVFPDSCFYHHGRHNPSFKSVFCLGMDLLRIKVGMGSLPLPSTLASANSSVFSLPCRVFTVTQHSILQLDFFLFSCWSELHLKRPFLKSILSGFTRITRPPVRRRELTYQPAFVFLHQSRFGIC